MPVLQALTDAVTALTAAETALATKVEAVLAANAGAATPAEQQTIADGITTAVTALNATLAKLG